MLTLFYLGDVKGAFPHKARSRYGQPPLERSQEGPKESSTLTPAAVVSAVLYHPSFLSASFNHIQDFGIP